MSREGNSLVASGSSLAAEALPVCTLALVSLVSLCCAPGYQPTVQGKIGYPDGTSCGRKHADLGTVELITTRKSLGEITDVLGEPARTTGSGAFVLEWDCTDGRRFYVSMAHPDPSSKPVEVGFTR